MEVTVELIGRKHELQKIRRKSKQSSTCRGLFIMTGGGSPYGSGILHDGHCAMLHRTRRQLTT